MGQGAPTSYPTKGIPTGYPNRVAWEHTAQILPPVPQQRTLVKHMPEAGCYLLMRPFGLAHVLFLESKTTCLLS